uniref:Uncharacterized protein n=1 Tax=Arundo donax TaxID=35708 RepID=A0A0A9DUF5_ARUDO
MFQSRTCQRDMGSSGGPIQGQTILHKLRSTELINSMSGEWSVGLCSCFGDVYTCMQSSFSVLLMLHVSEQYMFHFIPGIAGCLTCWCPVLHLAVLLRLWTEAPHVGVPLIFFSCLQKKPSISLTDSPPCFQPAA